MTLTLLGLLLAQFGSGEPGSTVMPLLKCGQGPRAAALGQAYVGLADDASALYWNPAGLAQLPDYHISFSHQQWFTGIQDELIHVALPSGIGTFGLGAVYSGNPGIEKWNERNEPGDTFRTWDGMLALGFGTRLGRDYFLGFAAKGMFEHLHTTVGYGGGADIGFIARPLPFLGLGIACRHLGLMQFSGYPENLPTELALGASGRFGPLVGSAEAVYPLDNTLNIRAGIEWTPVRELSVRLGYRTGPADITTLGFLSGLTAGLGVNLNNLHLDYSIAPAGGLGTTHRLGLTTRAIRRGQGSVRIRVFDAETNRPVRAVLGLSGLRDIAVETDRRGEFRLSGLPPGQLVIRTSGPGHAPRIDTMQILGDREQSAAIALEPVRHSSIWGRLFDAATKQPVGGLVVYEGPVRGEQAVDPGTGSFALRSLPVGSYQLQVLGPATEYIAQTCTLALEPGRVTSLDFYLLKQRQTIVLEGISFETGKAEILDRFTPVLERAGRLLVENPTIVVELAGHTDPREIATPEFPSNWELSQARAEAVRRYLIEKFAIAPDRLIARGYADTRPIASNDTEAGMARNRRTEFRLLEQ
uniref:PorV/PorQ family protein n=1 Tax=candidate division WOR-3 bacterium TaxID=2052148 RepID=A0A7C4GGU0_UNCW3